MEYPKCCATCAHLTPEGECDYKFDMISDEEANDSYCDHWKEEE